ncbi:MAG: hypothetical protein KDJ77_08665 [Rhodobiaceae bacterium]|nr:hypothetical protein [Rhodobiaceae bacterium]
MTFFKGSWYENVPLFDPDDSGKPVFKGLRARPLGKPEPVLEHSVALKERLDSLANHYYAEPRDWRRIAETNPDAIFAEDLLWETAPVDENGRERTGNVVLIPRRRETR